jgi:hypothetical protein
MLGTDLIQRCSPLRYSTAEGTIGERKSFRGGNADIRNLFSRSTWVSRRGVHEKAKKVVVENAKKAEARSPVAETDSTTETE